MSGRSKASRTVVQPQIDLEQTNILTLLPKYLTTRTKTTDPKIEARNKETCVTYDDNGIGHIPGRETECKRH